MAGNNNNDNNKGSPSAENMGVTKRDRKRKLPRKVERARKRKGKPARKRKGKRGGKLARKRNGRNHVESVSTCLYDTKALDAKFII